MNILLVVLFLIAAFHLCLYYCNMDFFTTKVSTKVTLEDLTDTKEILEKHLKELKQYNTHG
jgi:hypothetical protein